MDSDRTTVRPEELLAQLGWVKALARGLVYDPDVADDLLQRVCLLALQRAPSGAREGAGLRAWLASVTRSLAGRSVRSERRRLRREQAAAQAEALPSTSDLAERRETLRLLVDAVTGLEEPYFSSIVERYFEGLSVADIAARHGLATATVRQRLWRARQQLHARLERVVANDRSAWLAVLLPTAAAATRSATARAPFLTHHFGGLALAKTVFTAGATKAVLAVGVVAGLSLTVWCVLDESNGPEAPATLPHQVRSAESDAPSRFAALPPLRTADAVAAVTELELAAPVAAPVQPDTAQPGPDAVAELLDSAAATFLSNEPDLLALNRAVLALAQSATVVPDSVGLDPLDGAVRGSLAIAGSALKGGFTITSTGRYVVAFNSESPASVPPPFFQRSLVLSFKSEAALATDIGTVVQFNPNTSSASFPSLLSTLDGENESYIGWNLGIGHTGTSGQPMSMRREDGAEGPGLRIGKAATLPKLEAGWASDTSAYELWLAKLSGYAR